MFRATARLGNGVRTADGEARTMGKTLKILALVALAALLVSTATGCCPLFNSASDGLPSR